MAAGLANPKMLYSWVKNPELLRSSGIDPENFDLEALWRFSGLTTKVRHNDLRCHLPMTFVLLGDTGLEFDLFADYAIPAAELRAAGKNSVWDKLEGLFEFLQTWLDLNRRDHALLWTIFRHEATIAQIHNSIGQQSVLFQGCAGPEFGLDDIPAIRGILRVLEVNFDPRRLSNILRTNPSELPNLQPNTLRLGYWWEGDCAQMSLLELDESTSHLLSLIGGGRSVRSIARILAEQDDPRVQQTLLAMMGQLADLGLVAFGATNAD